MKRTLVVCAFLGASLAGPVFAILGVGDIVFDPTNFEEAAQQLLEMQQQYAQLIQSYQMIRNQYNQMLWMARQVPVNMAARYRALATPWQNSSATNTYGTTRNWITGVNTGMGVETGYSGATQPLASYGSALANIPADQLSRVKTNYATVELTDGANLAGMQTIGRMRANSRAVELAIQGLEDDSLSADPNMNTEIAVLNKINAAHLIMVRNTQDANKLLVALAEEQIIDAKRKRDAETQAINNHIRFAGEGRGVLAAQAAVILIAWFGAQSALASASGGHGPGFHFDRFASLLITIAFGFGMITFYSHPIPGFGISFYHLVIDQGLDLANRLNHAIVQEVWDRLSNLYWGMEAPGLSLALNIVEAARYFVTILGILAAQASVFAVIAFGYVAAAIAVLLGPIFIPFFIVPHMEWLFWGWLKSLFQYAFYPVVANAYVFVFGNLLIHFIDSHPPPYDGATLLLLFFPLLLLLIAFTYGIVKIPSLVNSLFTGRSGESGLPRL